MIRVVLQSTLAELTELAELYVAGNPFSTEGGEKPIYHAVLQKLIPTLEILDGVSTRGATGGNPLR